ncbi:MAG TPA: RsmE family RNA methyltransferase [Ilumatobacteraceae bacterium]|nr:RsmE family RNA methyltransferase [Ilumatobacteraceae bacterium]
MNPVLRGSAAHVFVESLAAPQLTTEDDHHLRRVLRIRESDVITISDGIGSWVTATLEGDGLHIASHPVAEPAQRPATIFSALPKGDRVEWIVQKLTEIGATSIGFIECSRSIVHWDEERSRRQVARLRRVAREAAMQSRRVWLPEILDVVPFSVAATQRPGCALADPAGIDEIGSDIDTVLIGPEGGFTAAELDLVARHVALSTNVLRVETAALVAGILLTLRHESE